MRGSSTSSMTPTGAQRSPTPAAHRRCPPSAPRTRVAALDHQTPALLRRTPHHLHHQPTVRPRVAPRRVEKSPRPHASSSTPPRPTSPRMMVARRLSSPAASCSVAALPRPARTSPRALRVAGGPRAPKFVVGCRSQGRARPSFPSFRSLLLRCSFSFRSCRPIDHVRFHDAHFFHVHVLHDSTSTFSFRHPRSTDCSFACYRLGTTPIPPTTHNAYLSIYLSIHVCSTFRPLIPPSGWSFVFFFFFSLPCFQPHRTFIRVHTTSIIGPL